MRVVSKQWSVNRDVDVKNVLISTPNHQPLATNHFFKTSLLIPRTLCIFLLLFALAIPAAAADKLDKYDSAYVSTLNMTDEEAAELYGVDSTKLNQGPTLQELNEENPTYVKREYNHRQQVIVGSVVMLCVAVAMVLMNNYNPKR